MIKFPAVSLFLAVAIVTPASADAVSAAQWRNRVLVVIAPTQGDQRLASQRQMFNQASRGMVERHVILVEALGDDPSARSVRRRLGLASTDFRAFLVGKDGHTAMSSTEPLTSDRLFRAIDAMPMRQEEIRRRR
jgi:hypothetical protein